MAQTLRISVAGASQLRACSPCPGTLRYSVCLNNSASTNLLFARNIDVARLAFTSAGVSTGPWRCLSGGRHCCRYGFNWRPGSRCPLARDGRGSPAAGAARHIATPSCLAGVWPTGPSDARPDGVLTPLAGSECGHWPLRGQARRGGWAHPNQFTGPNPGGQS